MATPAAIAGYFALFSFVGIIFVLVHLVLGALVRPSDPHKEKREIYECGEPTIGSSFVQFDLRFYVVALLFIIFDVEVAFFFPWATVFGKATHLMDPNMHKVVADSDPHGAPDQLSADVVAIYREMGVTRPTLPRLTESEKASLGALSLQQQSRLAVERSATRLATVGAVDICVFFSVLLVGFAYVWKRGDLDWVRAVEKKTVRERAPPQPVTQHDEKRILELTR